MNITDQMAEESGSKKWPFPVCFNILHLVRVNYGILCKNAIGNNMSRKDFFFRLAEELTFDYQLSGQEIPSEADCPTIPLPKNPTQYENRPNRILQ